MSQKLDTRKVEGPLSQEPIGKGRVWPNLVLKTDSGKKYVEFIAQCEVVLRQDEADKIRAAITGPGRTTEKLDAALQLILQKADNAGARPMFTEMLKLAFRAHPEYEKQK